MNPAAYGRYGDNTMVHMNNDEVAGLASLAKSMGRELTTNPVTGYPEAFSLRDALPIIAGIGTTAMGLGPIGTGLVVGGTTAATTGSLEQGLMSGLTAGALSGIGGELSDVAAQQATQQGANVTGQQMASDLASKGFTESQIMGRLAGTGATSELGRQTMGEIAGQAVSDVAQTGAIPYSSAANPMAAQIGTQATANTAPSMGQTMFGRMTAPAQGAYNIATGAPGAPTASEFLQANKGKIAAAGIGMSGEQQYKAQAEMEGRKEEMDRQKAEKLGATQDIIRRNYANVGRALPMNPYTGRPVFATGGIVNLMDGGRPYDNPEFEVEYEAAMSDEPWYRSLPADVVEGIFGIKDPYVMQKILDAKRAKARDQGVDERAAGGYLEGGMTGDGMSDDIPAMIDGDTPAALSTNEFVVPADVVSHLGNGSSDAGAQQLYAMMDRIRKARTGSNEQAPQVNAKKYMPA
jgi:hypothetical protein